MNYSTADTRWRQRRRRPAHPTNNQFHHGYCLWMIMAVILLLQLFSPPNDCSPTTTTPIMGVAAAAASAADVGANVDDDTTSSNANNNNLDNTAAEAQSSSSSQSTNSNGNNAGSSASATFNSAASSTYEYAASGNNNSNPALTSNSVVLITGAAGFLGSELALALLRTYKVHKLLLVDNLGIDSENESSYVPPPPKDDSNNNGEDYSLVFGGGAIYEVMSEEDVSMFEIKRQRAFRVLHEMTSPTAPDSDDFGEEIDNAAAGGDVGATSSKRRRRTRPEESIRFYRADMRPSIPEFFDVGELPLLEGIFQSHPDITHVVHLADVPLHAQNQVIPRNKDSIKTGCMEGILEEFRLMIERANITNGSNNSGNADGTTTNRKKVQLPHFVYASSHEVYDRISSAHASSKKSPQAQQQGVQGAGQQQQGQGQEMPPPQQPNPPPFQEDKPITTPSSLHGTAKLIDEILASAYHSTHGIYSVGLRFFQVYGPWDAPGTEVFDLAEQIWAINDSNGKSGVGSGGAGGSTTTIFDDSAFDEDINDYIYIDDAIDAILSAMQYRPHTADNNPPPVVFNVGSGKGYTRKQVKEEMGKHFQSGGKQSSPTAQQSKGAPPTNGQRLPTKSIASTARSESLLGFKAQVSLEEGLAQTLTWHRDRTYPYGRDPNFEESFEARSIESKIGKSLATSRRRTSISSGGSENDEEEGGNNIVQEDVEGECSPLDRECLRGTLVFPCASECRRVEWCTPSAWDDIAILSTRVTTGCDAVLYTVLLDESTEQIPSATAALAADSLPFVGAGLPEDIGERTQARCNIAFVSDKSPLVEMLKSEGEEYLDKEENGSGIGSGSSLPPLLRHGFWTVLPVSTSSSSSWFHAFGGTFSLEYLPKISPGRFFGSSVRFAVYAAPTVLVNNLPNLLKRMEDGPVPPQSIRNRSGGGSDGSSTALLISSKRNTCDPAQRGSSCSTTYTRPPANDGIQSNAYNMIRMALRGEMLGGGLEPLIDSSVLVHSLREEESRLFRCDVYGEAAQWGASSDERSFEFVISVHDLWSRAVNHWSTGSRPWWVDAGGSVGGTTTEGAGVNNGGANLGDNKKKETIQKQQRRRLLPAGGSKNMGELWMSILSSSEYQLFTLIMPSDSMGIVHLE